MTPGRVGRYRLEKSADALRERLTRWRSAAGRGCRARSPQGFAPKDVVVDAAPIPCLGTAAQPPETTRGIAPYKERRAASGVLPV